MQEAVLNADGFGLGWYINDIQTATYRNIQPIWSDLNLESLSGSLTSPLWMGNVRSATPGQATTLANTQPFTHESIMYIHNGYISHFNPELRTRFHQYLKPEIQATVHGDTDSEYLFAMVRQQLTANNSNLKVCIIDALTELIPLIAEETALLNMVIGDGQTIYATRHALNGQCPSLYYTTEDKTYPDAALVASECLTDPADWQEVPEHNLLILTKQQAPELIAL